MQTKWRIPALVLLALCQLWIPCQTIRQKEAVLAMGILYKFKTMPVDPSDPFRGKYIRLNFEQDTARVSRRDYAERGRTLYMQIEKDSAGFAIPGKISPLKEEMQGDYLRIKSDGEMYNDSLLMIIEYPFWRFYMEESKAPEAEKIQRRAQADTVSHLTYACVKVLDGEAVLEDVKIDGVSIVDLIRK